jgi:cyclophilin family peptidyl-prolyl cis-trans isomerase
LAAIARPRYVASYLFALTSDASQLLQSAAKALTGTRDRAVAAALISALDRVSKLRRETSRDARVALLDAIKADGDSALAGRLRPYLHDFDPAVATRAAQTLEAWTGARPSIAPTAPPAVPVPTAAELIAWSSQRATIEMADGSQITIRLFPLDAPTNVARFVRLAQRGYFNGLTFHRVAPFYVVQGGSPGANEYVGDGPFTRDELALENRRGTIGLSTRGRDTGDGQIYFNLIDNVQLDHDYTVFAEVISGMDAVEKMQEGAQIRRISVR